MCDIPDVNYDEIRFLFFLAFVFDKRFVLKYADQSRLRSVVKNICIPAYSFVLVLRYRLTIRTLQNAIR